MLPNLLGNRHGFAGEHAAKGKYQVDSDEEAF